VLCSHPLRLQRQLQRQVEQLSGDRSRVGSDGAVCHQKPGSVSPMLNEQDGQHRRRRSEKGADGPPHNLGTAIPRSSFTFVNSRTAWSASAHPFPSRLKALEPEIRFLSNINMNGVTRTKEDPPGAHIRSLQRDALSLQARFPEHAWYDARLVRCTPGTMHAWYDARLVRAQLHA